MAIDSAPKRRSVGGVPFLPLSPGVTPDATPGAEWRQQVAWSYSGIPTTPLAAPVISYPNPSVVAKGAASTITPTSTGGAVPNAGWTLQAGTLPDGLTLDADTGVISGTPTTIETQVVTIRATNATDFDDFEFTIQVVNAPTGGGGPRGFGRLIRRNISRRIRRNIR